MSEKLSSTIEEWKEAPRDFEVPERRLSRREIANAVAALEAKLENVLQAIELARRELGSYRGADDKIYVRNANMILAAAQE